MAIIKDVWSDRDNEILLLLESTDNAGNRTPTDLTTVTSVLLEFEGAASLHVNANDIEPPIDWLAGDLQQGEMRMVLGDFAATIPAGHYYTRLTLYSLNAPDGIVWASFARGELQIAVHHTADVAAHK